MSMVDGAQPTATKARYTGEKESGKHYPEIWSDMEPYKASISQITTAGCRLPPRKLMFLPLKDEWS